VVDRETFDLIRAKHGNYASWAVWAEPTAGPKSNIGDLSVLDPDRNPSLLGSLQSDVVMIGLNLSRFVPDKPFQNFHDKRSEGQDFKIRYAFAGTSYYGAYMTDVIKGVVELQSRNLMRHLASNQQMIAQNVGHLLEELDDLQSAAPTLIAFGGDAFALARHHIPRSRCSRLVRVTHYSHYLSKEAYRERVLAELAAG